MDLQSSRRRRIRGHIRLLVGLLLTPCALSWGQETNPPKGQPRITHVSVGFGRLVRPHSWAPVHVTLKNPGPATDVEIVAYGEEASGLRMPAMTRTRLHLPARAARRHTIYLQNADSPYLTLELYENGRRTHRRQIDPFQIPPGQPMILGLSYMGSGFGCDQERRRREGMTRLRFSNTTQFRDLPARWQGYDAVDVIVLGGLPPGGIPPIQERAIVNWVRAGGLLVLCPGGSPAHYHGSLIESISPVGILGRRLVESLPPFEATYGEFTRGERRFGLTESVVKDGTVHLQMGLFPLVVSRREGNGMVVFVAFDLSSDRVRGLPRLVEFYQDLSALHKRLPRPGATTLSRVASEILNERVGVPVLPRWVVGCCLGLYLAVILALLVPARRHREWGFAAVVLAAPCIALGINLLGKVAAEVSGNVVESIHLVRSHSGDSECAGLGYYGLLAEDETWCDVTFAERTRCFPAPLTDFASGRKEGRRATNTVREIIEFADDDVKGLRQLHLRPRALAKFATTFLADLPGTVEASATATEDGIRVYVTNRTGRRFSHGFVAHNRNAAAFEDLDPGESASVLLHSGTARGPMSAFSRTAFKSKRRARQDRIIRALYAPGGTHELPDSGVLVFGWVDGEPIKMEATGFDAAADSRPRTLWIVRAEMLTKGKRILLPKGTAAMRFRSSARPVFSNGRWTPIHGRSRIEVDFVVPSELRGMRASRITVFFRTGQGPAVATIEALNTETGAYDLVAGKVEGNRAVPIPLRSRRFSLAPAESYLSPQRSHVTLRASVRPATSGVDITMSRRPVIEDFDIEIEGICE